MYLLAPSTLHNVKKKILELIQSWGCAIFGPKMIHLSIIITFI